MTRKIAKRIVKGITDKIECNTADIDDWAEFWGFTRKEYEEFLDMPINALEQEPRKGHWIFVGEENEEEARNGNFRYICSECSYSDVHAKSTEVPYCWHCGAKMESEG